MRRLLHRLIEALRGPLAVQKEAQPSLPIVTWFDDGTAGIYQINLSGPPACKQHRMRILGLPA